MSAHGDLVDVLCAAILHLEALEVIPTAPPGEAPLPLAAP